MTERLLTPTKITAWLDCAHFLTLQHRVEDGTLQLERNGFGEFAQLLMAKGQTHEAACLAEYEAHGLTVLRVADREPRESFTDWVQRVGNPLDGTHDVIFQMPFVHDGIRGIADFLLKTVDEDGGITYEPVDAKLARNAAKPGHVLQLCFYADAIEALTGRRPERLHIWLGSGAVESVRTAEVRAYWARLRLQLAKVVADGPPSETTVPVPCDHCQFCTFEQLCDDEWRESDSLVYVAGLRNHERVTFEAHGVESIVALSELEPTLEAFEEARLVRLVQQAVLQVEARLEPDAPPPFEVLERGIGLDGAPAEHGFDRLPEPDNGDVFLDFEGHPFWRADTGLFFLFGLIERTSAGAWEYRTWWAHDRAEEAAATVALIEWLDERRAEFPGMHVYHYNHTERSALTALASQYGGATALGQMVESGRFVDLYEVVRNAIAAGTESYGLKSMELLAGFVRTEDIHGGASAVVEYEKFMADRDDDHLVHIAEYNREDVEATRALRDWLIEQRPADLAWRPAVFEVDESPVELDELVEQLHAIDDPVAHLMGDVMGYWQREWRAFKTPKLAKLEAAKPSLLDDPETIAGLAWQGETERVGKTGKVLEGSAMAFGFPEQALSPKFAKGTQVLYATPDGLTGYATLDAFDGDAGTMLVKWSERASELGTIPAAVALNDWVRPDPKPERLNELGWSIVDPVAHGAPNPVALALLRRNLPAFRNGAGPADGVFGEDLAEMKEWVRHLDGSCLAIQGPPGTGKTFRGAHIVHSLVTAGLRVGITSMSHHAIDNLLDEVGRVFAAEGDAHRLSAIRRVARLPEHSPLGVTHTTKNGDCADLQYSVVAGTTWLFANRDMVASPVDVLIIDEAGQLSLADSLAAMASARNVILLGDPLQLPQVAQASHPGGGGASVLEHLLGDEATISDRRGIFLSESRRMHPDVCRFISEEIYEGRLSSHEMCAVQSTDAGTGLRWLRAEHVGCSTESVDEAALVIAKIVELIGTGWVDETGAERVITPADVMVVAPYNDQVNLLRALLDADPATRGVAVGTVDKFQGRQAAVVFFTMTTSTADDMPRGPGFLFSRNRLNVAISRAKCLAYLVCTEQLLNSRARDLEEMKLISTLCAFVERCEAGSVGGS